ncbi:MULTISPECIES: hypothetical protein [unclassified Sphingomonas]|uniref:hypothetical protein n=1 Tax=unclassified Sphingomonas TaxID=196159 RepID=UPI000B263007|nr:MULTISPECIES: hypothetical protein [unclassified Sphingomonas]
MAMLSRWPDTGHPVVDVNQVIDRQSFFDHDGTNRPYRRAFRHAADLPAER